MAGVPPLYKLDPASLNAYKDQLAADAASHPGLEARYDEDVIEAIELQEDAEKNPQNARIDQQKEQILHLDEWNLFLEDPECARNAAPLHGHWVRVN